MMRSIYALFLTAWMPFMTASAGAATGSGSQPRLAGDAALRKDDRLQVKISRADKNRPLGELLADLGGQIHVSLSASPDTADDKVSLFLADRPAAEVMSLIARQFDFQWTPRGKGYELSQSVASRRREAELWEKEVAAQWQAIAAHMRLVAERVSLPRDQLEARRTEISRQLAAPDLAPAERERLGEEQRVIADLKSPFARAAVTLFSSLTPDQIRQLRSGRDVRFSTFDHTLPPALIEPIQQAYGERVKGSPLERGLSRQQIDVNIRLTDFTGPLYSPQRASQRSMSLEIGLTLGDSNNYAPAGWFPTMPPEKTPPAAVTTTDDPALKQELSVPAATSPHPAAAQPPGGWPADLLTIGDISEAIHRSTGLEVIADSFIRARVSPQLLAAKQPLAAMLDRIANELRYDWRNEGHLILLRSQVYYRDRPEEVPERILGPWRKQIAAEGAPTLDSMAALAAALDENRARGMHDFWGWYLEGSPAATAKWADDFFRNRYHLRLWAALTPPQRQAALAQAPIPVPGMSAAQRQALIQALTARDETVWGPMRYPRTLMPADLATASFAVEVRPFQEQKFRLTLPSGNSIEFSQPLDKGPAGLAARAGGTGPQPEPVGPASWFDSYTFEYRLGAQEEPVAKAPMNLPRRTPPSSGTPRAPSGD